MINFNLICSIKFFLFIYLAPQRPSFSSICNPESAQLGVEIVHMVCLRGLPHSVPPLSLHIFPRVHHLCIPLRINMGAMTNKRKLSKEAKKITQIIRQKSIFNYVLKYVQCKKNVTFLRKNRSSGVSLERMCEKSSIVRATYVLIIELPYYLYPRQLH